MIVILTAIFVVCLIFPTWLQRQSNKKHKAEVKVLTDKLGIFGKEIAVLVTENTDTVSSLKHELEIQIYANKQLKNELSKYNQTPFVQGIGFDYAKGIYDHPLKVVNPPLGTSRIRIEMREHQPIRIYCKVEDGVRMYHGVIADGTSNIILTHLVDRNQRMNAVTNQSLLRVDSVPDDAAKQKISEINSAMKKLKGQNQ